MKFKFVFKYICLIYLCISQVFCNFGITNINILDDYYDDATNFLNNQPIIDGITLILPQEIPVRENLSPVSHIWPPFRLSARPPAPLDNSEPFNNKFKTSHKTPSKRKRKPYKNGNKFIKNKSKYEETSSLFDNSPPNSIPNEFNFHKPIIKLSDAKSQMPDQVINSPKTFNAKNFDYKRQRRPKKFRTATANQLSHSTKDKQEKKDNEKSVANDEKHLESDDPNHYPHQYAIEIRWKNKNNEFYDPKAPSGDYGGREMHSSKDFEHSKYRLFEHKEEEHWHEKKWLNEGLKKGYIKGQSVPMHIFKPSAKIESNAHFNPMPIYAQPMPDGSTLEEIDEHFAIPTPSFRVNSRFIKWARNAIDLSKPQHHLSPAFG